MGYEIKLIIAIKDYASQDGRVNDIATIDLCKCGYDGALTKVNKKRKSDDGKTYYYTDGVDTKIKKDSYGDFLRVRSLDEVMEALEKGKSDFHYRRFVVALALLKAIKETFYEEIVVLLYGH